MTTLRNFVTPVCPSPLAHCGGARSPSAPALPHTLAHRLTRRRARRLLVVAVRLPQLQLSHTLSPTYRRLVMVALRSPSAPAPTDVPWNVANAA
jgi:hypothetical protein